MPSSTPIATQHIRTLEQFSCPNCGGTLELANARSQYITCHHCGSQLDATHPAHRVISQLALPKKFPPRSFIRLGARAVIDGVEHRVIGRARLKMDYWEYWSDEDGSGWEKEKWEYDEWLLMNEHRQYFYLVEDKEGYSVSRNFIPTAPCLPKRYDERITFFANQKPGIQAEHGTAEVVFFEGESTYQVSIGDRVGFGMVKGKGGREYSVEWRPATGNVSEIEFFETQKFDRYKVGEWFGYTKSDIRVMSGLHPLNSFVISVSLWALLAAMILLAFGSFSGTRLAEGEFRVPSTVSGGNQMVLVGEMPLRIKNAPRAYEVELRMDLPDNREGSAGFEIIKLGDSSIVNAADSDFWRESGTSYECDEDGCGYYDWSESELKQTFAYQATAAGDYLIRVYAKANAEGMLRVAIAESQASRHYLFAAGFFVVLIIFSFFVNFGKLPEVVPFANMPPVGAAARKAA